MIEPERIAQALDRSTGKLVSVRCPAFLLRNIGGNLFRIQKNTVPHEALLALDNMRARQSGQPVRSVKKV